MSDGKDSMRSIITVAVSVCFVCAVFVSATSVSLKPQQRINKELDRNKNVLVAAGLFEEDVTSLSEIPQLFERIETRVVDFQEGRVLSEEEAAAVGIDPARYDQRKAAKDAALSIELTDSQDVASISRRARYSVVYLLRDDSGIEKIVLPVHGYGLWSVMYGFLALESDGSTVGGITFYDQKETAGLGGEVENPAWKAGWRGKQVFDDAGDIALRVVKGKAMQGSAHDIDGLSGATLTSRGVQNLVAFWMGDDGFGPVLEVLKRG